jgi:hypothetical protein
MISGRVFARQGQSKGAASGGRTATANSVALAFRQEPVFSRSNFCAFRCNPDDSAGYHAWSFPTMRFDALVRNFWLWGGRQAAAMRLQREMPARLPKRADNVLTHCCRTVPVESAARGNSYATLADEQEHLRAANDHLRHAVYLVAVQHGRVERQTIAGVDSTASAGLLSLMNSTFRNFN